MRLHWLGAALHPVTAVLPLVALVSAGCTSAYDIRIGGHVTSAVDDQPVDDAVVAVAPCFDAGRDGEVAHCGGVDESGAFRYASSGRARDSLRGVEVVVKAPGFAPVEHFVAARDDGKIDERELRIVLEDARTRARAPIQGAPAAPPPH